jgi:hypothetical protein
MGLNHKGLGSRDDSIICRPTTKGIPSKKRVYEMSCSKKSGDIDFYPELFGNPIG